MQWQKCYGGDHNEIGRDIELTQDGGYVVSGSAESENGDATCNAGITDMWVIKINNTGQLIWQKSMGGNFYEDAFSVHPLNDGSYIVAGYTCSKDVAGYHAHDTIAGACADYLVIKLSAPVNVSPAPSVTINLHSGSACAGNNVSFVASALYAGTNPAYSWVRKWRLQ